MSPKGLSAQNVCSMTYGGGKGKRGGWCREVSCDQITQSLEHQAEELGLYPEGTGEPWEFWEQRRHKVSSGCSRTMWGGTGRDKMKAR